MASVGAVYCIYEPSAFLFESVQRIYPLVDKIIFLINYKPWYGEYRHDALVNTFKIAVTVPDPENKFEILSSTWESEAEQRNIGLQLLKSRNIDWCLIVDDDEFFNQSELKNVFGMLNDTNQAAFLIYHQIYWKNKNTIIEGLFGSFPTLAKTNGLVDFNENRMILVAKTHTWDTIPADIIVCHHMSYVRTNKEMLKKIQNFSHADTVVSDWYERVWLNWKDDMTDFHPTTPQAFKRIIPASDSKYILEDCKISYMIN